MTWLWTLIGSLISGLFRKPDNKQAYDNGVTQGETGNRLVMEETVAKEAANAKTINQAVNIMPDHAAADELHNSWTRD